MENTACDFSSSPYLWESVLCMTAGVAGNTYLTAGLLLCYVLLGLASYIWAFWSQRSRLKTFQEAIILSLSGQHRSLRGVQNIHDLLMTLFFMDIVNAITAIILAIRFAGSICNSGVLDGCAFIFILWFLSRCFGVVLHLLNAFVCILFLCHPKWGAKLRCIYASVSMLILVFVPFCLFVRQVGVVGLGVITFGLVLAIIAKCATSTVPPPAATYKKLIGLVAMLTFLIVYVPTFILQCLVISAGKYFTIYVDVLFCTNFLLAMDGLLCYVILKLPSEEEEPQQEQQQHQSLENPNYDIPVDVIT